ncbi:MAG TPA: response regulator [Ramlibacter sp.]|uniref:response regulator n=1 Tax=Ramlibacter sp. TaxID=1917967 RepID=UPI002D7EF896|nr:response regulator [Ramlibacter sp.]HET8744112.1 response regulator [Ramlibacter sp.]
MAVSTLIVDHEAPFLRRFADAVLDAEQLRLCGAVRTFGAAAALIDALRPDVVVSEVDLPDGSGIDVIRHAVARRADCGVLVATHLDDDRHVRESFAAGARGYLLKDSLHGTIAAPIHRAHPGSLAPHGGLARQADLPQAGSAFAGRGRVPGAAGRLGVSRGIAHGREPLPHARDGSGARPFLE